MVFKYTTSYLVMICYFNYAWLLVLGVGCWVLGVGCWVLGVGCWVLGVGCWVLGVGLACATRRHAGRQAGRQQLACAMLGYGLPGTG